MTAYFERSKVFIPIFFRDFRGGINPKPKLVQMIFDADCAVAHSVEQDAAERPPGNSPIGRSLASTTKNHVAQAIAQTLGGVRVGFVAEALGEGKKFLLLALLCFDAVFDQLN